ncbi:hypothetical protein [Mycolicibacterium sphagni]|uniref:hypothetical protein n=1 Tax=Mycolicibacterium sphagni TaxID=1786 RepID=UPI0021F26B9B|nr:hypothetical protein [Mycolicibacterium sphagni]MCV7178188.1 hypothetical protein [Mycolicibacterium sphagni]
MSDRQIRRAVHALADRELVVLTKSGSWKGRGRDGRLRVRSRIMDDPDGPGYPCEVHPDYPYCAAASTTTTTGERLVGH